MSDNLPVIGV